MGKKKGKDRSPSTETPGVSCTHIRKGIDQSLLKKAGLSLSSCQDCEPIKPVEEQIPEDEIDREGPALWMCLKCGHRGCGRAENQHAIKHYETPRSEPHCLVLSLDVWSVWCYICDDEVQYSSTGQLAQLITNIRKQALTDPGKSTSNKKSKKEEKPADQTLNEEKENKENQKSNSKHDDSPKRQKAAAAAASGGSSGVVCVRGLSNLGNTCFFNAVVQNLSQTQLLRELLNQISDEKSCFITPSSELEALQIQLEKPGSLTLAMCQLLNEVQDTKKGVVTPKELFTQVCKKAPRFKGFQQQDSQELLRYLLDGMRAEEMKRVNSGILEALKNSGKSLAAEQMKKVIKEYEKNGAPKNFVDRVFGGEMSSTVMCKECRTVSLVTEMFLDLSLPVADEAYRKKNQKKVAQYRSSVSDDGDQDSTTSLANGNEDMLTGTGSKYQQKKAKKQAKKQAKNQRRQQKIDSKVILTNQSTASNTDPADGADQSLAVNGSTDVEQVKNSQEHFILDKPSANSQNEDDDDDDEEPEQELPTAGKSRFAAEDQTSEDVSLEGDKVEDVNEIEEDDCADQLCAEEDQLVEELNIMSLKTASEGERENGEDVSGDAKEYTVVNQDPELAFHTLTTRVLPEKQECSVKSCLYQFTEVEHLTENNRLMCVTCTKRQSGPKASDGGKKAVYRDALKQMLISHPPVVLTLHLKRFQQVGYSVCKVNRHVQFPQILDLAPFCSLNCKGVKEGETQVLYSLYGIVEHSGTMRSGHYTAYVKSRPSTHNYVENGSAADCNAEASKGSWFHVSDSSVHPVTEAKVQSSQAYLLFYEKIS
ncbi:ubiquitin carboxyl-terminal hydrolase 16 [Pseudorasbora parva]|uniref:ubiquitin carboxyl-terminal hydrolase 16 n=1 Tax=Pseudorasbora parva TaxID=51549 RepID=UPI00351F1C21